VLHALTAAGRPPGAPLALVVTSDGVAVASPETAWHVASADPADVVRQVEAQLRPRWVWWSARSTAAGLVEAVPRLRLARCWDLAAVHRLLHGGGNDTPAQVWAACQGLDPATLPRSGQPDLLSAPDTGDPDGDSAEPLRADGHLRPEWADGAWAGDPARAMRWAQLAARAQRLQQTALAALDVGGNPVTTAWSESAAELLAVELAATGLPLNTSRAQEVVAAHVGARPADDAAETAARAARDAAVLRLVPGASELDLRSPAQVKTLLREAGFDLPDTRSWRLERLRGAHPVIDALLTWRVDDRFATTYGYRWLDRHVHGGRLRGGWSGSDGGAGRMTAQAGLHSMPAELRCAVQAEPGHLLVRADLGQVEPRVLAAVSGDPALAAAADAADLYAPVAARLGCDRPVAKVAVLAAMYGQTSGVAGQALAGMEREFPVAMRYLKAAAAAGREGRAVRTHGGRLVRGWSLDDVPPEAGPAAVAAHRSAVAARGRFSRNAVVPGAAAELFKAWAATVRLDLATAGAGEVVLCLHDELLLQVRQEAAADVAIGVVRALDATAGRWCGPGRRPVRFVADVAVVERWSDAG
jgi:DNA polymerase-1